MARLAHVPRSRRRAPSKRRAQGTAQASLVGCNAAVERDLNKAPRGATQPGEGRPRRRCVGPSGNAESRYGVTKRARGKTQRSGRTRSAGWRAKPLPKHSGRESAAESRSARIVTPKPLRQAAGDEPGAAVLFSGPSKSNRSVSARTAAAKEIEASRVETSRAGSMRRTKARSARPIRPAAFGSADPRLSATALPA